MLEVVPWHSLFGGMLLGVSATLLMLFNGKVAGISGVINGLISPRSGEFSWRLLFFTGMVLGGLLSVALLGVEVPVTEGISLSLLISAGLLVGLGTRMANGCTSGHGICGIGRLSKRSIIATCVFMLVAGVTVYFRLHVFQ
ncbi:YeeE/YedE family protein [Vibrio sinaloensis]|uniref:YeeE/YedE family protein n=1 Tax=Vibrio TaxID=662 RepID=UPI0022B0640D|nr:YeeE/YedE family protein [Vibrio sinaloensis]MCZ4292501.1 YeeE/YedE family protein [Vibrio sinaloensis]